MLQQSNNDSMLLGIKQFCAHVWSIKVAMRDARPPLTESKEYLLIAAEYEGRCRALDFGYQEV